MRPGTLTKSWLQSEITLTQVCCQNLLTILELLRPCIVRLVHYVGTYCNPGIGTKFVSAMYFRVVLQENKEKMFYVQTTCN